MPFSVRKWGEPFKRLLACFKEQGVIGRGSLRLWQQRNQHLADTQSVLQDKPTRWKKYSARAPSRPRK